MWFEADIYRKADVFRDSVFSKLVSSTDVKNQTSDEKHFLTLFVMKLRKSSVYRFISQKQVGMFSSSCSTVTDPVIIKEETDAVYQVLISRASAALPFKYLTCTYDVFCFYVRMGSTVKWMGDNTLVIKACEQEAVASAAFNITIQYQQHQRCGVKYLYIKAWSLPLQRCRRSD